MLTMRYMSHVLYPVYDVEASFSFLTEVLGCYPQRRGPLNYVGIGDTLIELLPSDVPPASGEMNSYVFGFAVDDLDETMDNLRAIGVPVIRIGLNPTSFWGRQAIIDPPGGSPIALREWYPPDGPHFTGWEPRDQQPPRS